MSSVRISRCSRLSLATSARSRRLYTTASQGTAGKVTVTEDEVQAARAYCSNLLRTYDVPSHTLQTFVPPSSRDAYLAIRAFNIDVARVADTTSTPTIGLMRMQFWRDAVSNALSGSPPKEPVAILLARAATDLGQRTGGQHRLSRTWFHRIINTRAEHLSNPPYPDLASLETYAEHTYSTLLYLTLSSLPLASITADHIASHIGKATGITAILRGLPLIAFPHQPTAASNSPLSPSSSGKQHGAVLLPLDVMAEAGVKEEEVLRHGPSAPGLRDAVFTVATRANDHLIIVREMLKNLRAGDDVGHAYEHPMDEEERQYAESGTLAPWHEVERAFGVFMPAVATSLWLDRLQKVDFDLFHPSVRTTDWRLPWKAYWAFTRKQL